MACMWGRNVYDNIRKFLQFQLTVNVVALMTAFVGSVILKESPLAAVQLLWVNLIMDSLASLALATELPKLSLLQRPPYRKREYIISQKMMKHILGQAFFQCVVLMIFIFAGDKFIPEGVEGPFNDKNLPGMVTKTAWDAYVDKQKGSGNPYVNHDWNYVFTGMPTGLKGESIYEDFRILTPSRHLTVIFNLFVLFQIFNMLAARKIQDERNIFEGCFGSPMFLSVWLVIVIGQGVICTFGGNALKVHSKGLTV